MLSLAAVMVQSPWDLAVTCSRLQGKQCECVGVGGKSDGGREDMVLMFIFTCLSASEFVKRVLEHFSEDFRANSSSLRDHILRQYFTTCSLLHR